MSAAVDSVEEHQEELGTGGDLVERVETTRFVGREFLVWLWFKSELFEGEFKRADGSLLVVWLDSQLVLQSATDAQERIQFNGVAPTATQEAKLALRFDKLPVRARICVTKDTQDFSFIYEGETFSFASVKLPALLTQPSDEQFLERMSLLELLDDLFSEMWLEFLGLRLSPLWDKEFVPAVQRWAQGNPSLSQQGYRGLLKRA